MCAIISRMSKIIFEGNVVNKDISSSLLAISDCVTHQSSANIEKSTHLRSSSLGQPIAATSLHKASTQPVLFS